MSGQLTTHVLDTAHGKPAAGVTVELWREHPGEPDELLTRVVTNANGRTDAPLLGGKLFQTGHYVLRFATGSYWRSLNIDAGNPPFLDVIPIAFGIADPEAHYHVPLLVSPWAYSTYRGS